MTMNTADFSVGEQVRFGRGRGEKTLGTVVKVNPRKLKVRQDEARGAMKSHAIGTIWTVPPTLVEKTNGSSALPAPVTRAPAFPSPYKAVPTFKVGDQVAFEARGKTIVGFVRRVNAKTISVQPVGASGSRYWRVSPGLVRKANGPVPAPAPAPKRPEAKRPEMSILRDIDGIYCELSPESLTCDGELSGTQVLRRSRALNARLRALFTELGREVSEMEVFNRLRAN